jgi:hypothetical protein
MATHTHTTNRRPRRHGVRLVGKVVAGHWLLVLLSHTIAVVVLMVVDHFLRVTPCGTP